MLHLDPEQLPEVQHLHHEAVRPPALEQVTELLPHLAPARVSVDAVDGHENVGVRAGSFHVTRDDDDLVLDRDQVANFACEALDGLEALERLELVLLSCQGELCVAVEEISEQREKF